MARTLITLFALVLTLSLAACGAGTTRDTRGLLIAAEEGNTIKLKEALDSGVRPDDTLNVGDRTALLIAAMHGHSDIVQLLLERGADPNAEFEGAGVKLSFRSFLTVLRDVHSKPDMNGTYVKQDGTRADLKSIPLRESEYPKILKLLDDAAAKSSR